MSELSQLPIKRELKWWEGDPISMTAKVKGVDWSGDYVGNVRDSGGTSILTITVSATYSASTNDTTFVFTCADTDDVTDGSYSWDVKQYTDDATPVLIATRFAGSVLVESHPY